MPVNSTTLAKTSPTHAVATSGARPSIAAGRTIDAAHAMRSFVRLISARRLPAIAKSDFCFGLDASSSASPWRGSMSGLTEACFTRCGSSSALGGIKGGRSLGVGGETIRGRP